MRMLVRKRLKKPNKEIVKEQTISLPMDSDIGEVQIDKAELIVLLFKGNSDIYTDFKFATIDITNNHDIDIPYNYKDLGTLTDGSKTYRIFQIT